VRLTGKSSTENIDGWRVLELSDIEVSRYRRPVLLQHSPTKRINLDLPLDFKPCPLKPQIESANAGKEAPDRHRLNSCRSFNAFNRRFSACFWAGVNTDPHRRHIPYVPSSNRDR
jgi:hypothetical protein